MKITFFSNFLNHHQIPVCNAFYKQLGHDYTFVQCEKVPEERLKLGYLDDFSSYPYFFEVKDDTTYQKALQLGLESDIVIIGSADDIFIAQRIKENKLTFRYSERLFKTNKHVLLYPLILLSRLKSDVSLRNKNVYMLSSSAFTPLDYTSLFSYPNRFFKWGYFPEYVSYDEAHLFNKKHHDETKIIWVGRMISWKKPMMAIKTTEKLIQKGYKVHLDLIGTGPLEDELKSYIQTRQLSQYMTLLGSMKPDQVREHMLESNIFLFTSTKQEGWGAVLNEAMNSGCATYSYYRIGAAPYLINPGVNGKLFTTKKSLIKELINDLNHPNRLDEMCLKAYETIKDQWNAENAVSRFIEVSISLMRGEPISTFEVGPMSKAEIMTGRKIRNTHLKRVKSND